MKKTNFTLKRSLVWMTMFVLGLFYSNSIQAQCALACNDDVQVSTAPASLADPNACEISLSLDMVLEGADDFYVFDPVGACSATKAVLEVRNGNLLIAADTLTDVNTAMPTTVTTTCDAGQAVPPGGFGWTLVDSDCAGSGTATYKRLNGFSYLDRELTTKVILLDGDNNPINTCWGKVSIEDKAGPIFDCGILLLDKLGFAYDATGVEVINPAAPGDPFQIFAPCSFDLSLIPTPLAFDNCDIDPTEYLISEAVDVSSCNGGSVTVDGNVVQVVKKLTRRYGSVDFYGNQGEQATVEITLYQAQLQFPDDITWTCEQFEVFPNIVEPTALHPMIIAAAQFLDASSCHTGVSGDNFPGEIPYDGYFNLPPFDPSLNATPYGYIPNGFSNVPYWLDREALDVDLDPYYDDNFDNPVNDNSGACGTATNETDTECIHNISALRVGCGATDSCDLNAAHATTNDIITPVSFVPGFGLPPYPFFEPPIYEAPFCFVGTPAVPSLGHVPAHPIHGLEDADLLELSGSGLPTMFDQHGECNFTFTFSDQKVEACAGQGTDKTFKILRTWTALNWCTGQVTTDIQIIKVIDKRAPVVVASNQTIISDQTNNNGNHTVCASSGLIDPPFVFDACSGTTDVKVYTPAGQATPVEANGRVIGYRIPAPYLEMGTHTITVEVSDGCGNTSTGTITVEVIDGIPPINVCREVTQIALASPTEGITSIHAKYFDEGSYDYCSNVYFKVRKMELGTCDDANIDKPEEVNHVRGPRCDIPAPEEWFDDDVKFCCEEVGTTVNVILRVYDQDPDFLLQCGPKPRPVPTVQNAVGLHKQDLCGDCQVSFGGLNDNYNDCMVEVLVEDKSKPLCVPPAEVWIDCDDLPENIDWDDVDQLNDLFGEATAIDNCGAEAVQINVSNQLNLCGVGNVIRTFRATDNFGNVALSTCRQLIGVQNFTSYCITMPEDFEGECDNSSNPQDLTFTEMGCDLLAVSKEVRPFNAGGPAGDECRKDLITWRVINWCEYDGVSDPVRISRDALNDGNIDDGLFCSTGSALVYQPDPRVAYPSTGYYEWEQHVKIFDNTAPVVTYNGDVKFPGGDIDEDPCTGPVDISVEVVEECTDLVTVRWELSAFSSSFTGATFTGTDHITGRYPLGTHTARFFVSDDCGNTSFLDVTFDVVDAKAPTPVCYNGLSIDVMPASGMVEAWASDFDASSFDYCQDIKFAINRIDDVNGDGVITEDDHVTTVPNTDNVIFTCDDVGTLVYVQLWVGETPGDGCNDWDYCTTFMEVQDNNNSCGNTSSRASISGSSKTEDGVSVTDVDVTLSGDMSSTFTTDNSGLYSFNNLVIGNDYTVTPMRNDDIRNGVSTFDLALISKHILNVQPLNSAYKVLAADANRNGTVTTLDLVAIRKVVLFVSNEFPNNTSWRFIDKNHVFTNANNPWNSIIPENTSTNNITGNVTADFVAVKVGDVSGDAEAQNIGSIEDRTFNGTFFLNAQDKAFKAGETVKVEFNADLASVAGYQATFNFNTKALELVDVIEGESTNENFGLTMVEKGVLTTSWNGVANSENAFTLVFTAKANSTLSDEIAVSSEYTAAEAYSNDGLQQVGINFGSTTSTTDYALYQNTPNPFKGETTIKFYLPEATTATLTVSDVSGKVIEIVKGDYNKGDNYVTLNSENLVSGVLYYQLDTDNFSATKKMIIIE